jgi:hypothetical protein
MIDASTGNQVTVPNYEPVLEFIFELVRRLEFGNALSRLTSFYGCDTIQEARQFACKYPGKPIFELESNRYEVRDMAYLALAATPIHCWENARRYWSGMMSANPKRECVMELPITIGKQVATV